MEQTENVNAKNGRLYVGLLSLTLFLCPILIFVLARIFSAENINFGYQDFALFTAYWLSAAFVWTHLKFMWLATTCILCLVILMNIIVLFRNISSDSSPVYITQFILSIASFSGVLLIAELLNSKSFDRRDQFSILGAAKRFSVEYAAGLVNGAGQNITGTITSLSFSGALLEVHELPIPFYLQDCYIKIPQIEFFGKQKVEVIELGSKHLRLRFNGFNFLVILRLYNHLKASDQSKAPEKHEV